MNKNKLMKEWSKRHVRKEVSIREKQSDKCVHTLWTKKSSIRFYSYWNITSFKALLECQACGGCDILGTRYSEIDKERTKNEKQLKILGMTILQEHVKELEKNKLKENE